MNIEDLAFDGAKRVITDCLSLLPEDSLLIVHDETTTDVANKFQSASKDLQIRPIIQKVPIETQRAISNNKSELERIIRLFDLSTIRGVLTCTSDDTAFSGFRQEL